MRRRLIGLLALLSTAAIALAAALLTFAPRSSAQHLPKIAQYLKPGLPIELVSAAKADRVAWLAYEEGKRNVFTAAAPDFKPVRVTSFLKDDGVACASPLVCLANDRAALDQECEVMEAGLKA